MPTDATAAVEDVTGIGTSAPTFAAPVGPARLARPTCVSPWRLIAAAQVVEALTATATMSIWLSRVAPEAGPAAIIVCSSAVAIIMHVILRSLRAYDLSRLLSGRRSVVAMAFAWLIAGSPMLLWTIHASDVQREASYAGWLACGCAVVMVRLGFAWAGRLLVRLRRINHNIVIIGDGAEARACANAVRMTRPGMARRGTDQHAADRYGAAVVGIISPAPDWLSGNETESVPEYVSGFQRLFDTHHITDVIVATSEHHWGRVPEIVRELRNFPVGVLIWPHSVGVEPAWLATQTGHRIGMASLIQVGAPPLSGWSWVLRDIRERLLALLLIVFFLPVLLVIATMIRFSSPGPVFFRQQREGYAGRFFRIYKFRTMHWVPASQDNLTLTTRSDSRVFGLGAVLRKTSLDELPQLFNVLRGDMWLVGPRPHSPLATAGGQRYAAAVPDYSARFRVKPGITGWAQVNGHRGATDTVEQIRQRVAHDLYYIENQSLWMDAQILMKTVTKGFVHHNAY